MIYNVCTVCHHDLYTFCILEMSIDQTELHFIQILKSFNKIQQLK